MRLLSALARPGDDRGSLPMALLVITVATGMSAVLGTVVIRQSTATRTVESRDVALNAAQAGMDLMMARVRAASDSDNFGLLEKLPPCTMNGDAAVTNVGDKLTYKVTVQYRDEDGKALPCPTDTVPTTAVVTSVGDGTNTAARTLTATYVFSTSNTNIPGGQIKIDTSSLGDQCIDANTNSKSPAAGTRVIMKKCNGSSRQQFGYTTDLYLKLVYSESLSAPYGMCLDAPPSHARYSYVVFAKCPATQTYNYQWSLDGSSRFHSTGWNATTKKQTIEGTCMAVEKPNVADSYLWLDNCGSASNTFLWRSAPGVGAGMAGDATAQLVNYEQFSRCLDVTNQSVGSTYMIAWFCKQSPSGAVDWNQIWVHPVPTPPAISKTGPIIITTDGSHAPNNTPHCLKSPGSTSATIYVTVVECTTAAQKAAPEVQWTVYHDTGVYATSYRILDYKNFCLAPTSQTAVPKDAHGDGTSKVKVATCNSSELQKWNAPANLNKPTPLTDLEEK